MKNLDYKNFKYHDSYGILEPRNEAFDGFPILKNQVHHVEEWLNSKAQQHQNMYRDQNMYRAAFLAINYYHVSNIVNLMHQTGNSIAMKMLKIYGDGNAHHYDETRLKLFPNKPYGHDIDCWQSLKKRKLIELAYKGNHGKQFFKITDLGKEILKIISVNYAFYRIFRWFKFDDQTKAIEHMVQADLQGEKSWEDQEPKVVIELLEAMFNPDSDMHKLGSCYRWMNIFMRTLATQANFYELVKNPEIMEWLENHKLQYPGIEIILKKINSKSLKKKFSAID